MNLFKKYTEAFESNSRLDYTVWFDEDPDPIEEIRQDYLLSNLIISREIAIEMLDQGLTFWEHLGWWVDIFNVMEQWAIEGALVRVRLTADWLLKTDPIADAIPTLQALADGNFLSLFDHTASAFPRSPEFYLQNLLWKTVSLACNREAEILIPYL